MSIIDLFKQTVSTEPQDMHLFKQLGLKPYRNAKPAHEIVVGQVNLRAATVEITVIPARFLTSWRAKITSKISNRKFEIKTGTGPLKSYWPQIQHIATSLATDQIQITAL